METYGNLVDLIELCESGRCPRAVLVRMRDEALYVEPDAVVVDRAWTVVRLYKGCTVFEIHPDHGAAYYTVKHLCARL